MSRLSVPYIGSELESTPNQGSGVFAKRPPVNKVVCTSGARVLVSEDSRERGVCTGGKSQEPSLSSEPAGLVLVHAAWSSPQGQGATQFPGPPPDGPSLWDTHKAPGTCCRSPRRSSRGGGLVLTCANEPQVHTGSRGGGSMWVAGRATEGGAMEASSVIGKSWQLRL